MASQGISQTDVNVNDFLPAYAAADFKHDFKDDKITLNVLNDIENVGDRTKFILAINPLINKNAFEVFNSGFHLSIPTKKVTEFKTEDVLLEESGIPYDATMKLLGSTVYSPHTKLEIPIAGGKIFRNYSRSFALEKVKRGGVGVMYEPYLRKDVPPIQYVNLVSCLWALSAPPKLRKKTFVIMYDAGTCATSEINDITKLSISDILENPIDVLGEAFNKTDTYEVYFITNSENARDPAPKITETTFKNLEGNVSVYFLKDYGHKVRYDMLTKSTAGLQTSNLYSNYSITTNRELSGNKVRATLDFGDGTSLQLDDVKRESEIGSSIINAVSMYLKNGTNILDEKLMSCFFLKRSGDWCQALSLLDKERKYTIEGFGPKKGNVTTLQQLEDSGGEVMLMTHDRILLTYAITLGLNVLYTNNRTSGHWLVYFKNMDIFRIDDVDKLRTDAGLYGRTLTELRAKANASREDARTRIRQTPWFPLGNIAILRESYTLLANLPSDTVIENTLNTLKTLLENVQQYGDMYKRLFKDKERLEALSEPDQKRARAFSNEIGKLRNVLPNIQSVIDIITKYTSAFSYPNQAEEYLSLTTDLKQVITEQKLLKSSYKSPDGRTFNLEAAYVVIAERLIDDVVASGGDLIFPTDGDIPALAQTVYGLAKITRTQIGTFRGIIDIFSKAFQKKGRRVAGGGGLQMGGVGMFTDAYFLPRVLYLLTEISIPIKGIVPDEWAFTVGEKLIHYDRWQYTIVDSYIATKENRYNMYGALYSATQLTKELTPIVYGLPILSIVMFRLLILYLDILDNEARLVIDAMNSYTDRDPDIDYKSPEQVTMLLISIRIQKLTEIVTMAVASIRFTDEIFDKLDEYEEEDFSGIKAGDINKIGLQITDLRNKILAVYTSTLAPYMYKIRQAEMYVPPPPPPPADEGNPNFIILFDPVTTVYAPYLYTPANAQFKGNQQVILKEKPSGFSHWQNIATNVYIPLLPQPIEQPRLPGLGVGGLRPRRPLYSNAEGPHLLTDIDPAQRKRRKTRRVRKPSSKSRRRRTV